ncbi:MAG: hypothetical protein ACM3S1_02240 [Hyphomicrobiales bacterium]
MTVSPLFPIRGAVPDLMLCVLVATAVYAGPRPAMAAIPAGAILLGFSSDRAPGLLLIGYMPLVPAAFMLEEARLPLNRFLQTLIVGAGTGLWARLMLSCGAFAEGAAFSLSGLLFAVLVPGLILDILLVTFVYLPFRLLGWTARPMTLQRSGY